MAKYRKLGRTSDQRKALLRSQVTSLLYRGKIVTTEAKAKEIRKIAEGIIALGIKEKDNFDTVTVTAKVARKDKDGKRVKEVVDGKYSILLLRFLPQQLVRRKTPRRSICLQRYLMKSLPSTQTVRVVTPESLRSASVRAMVQWKLYWS